MWLAQKQEQELELELLDNVTVGMGWEADRRVGLGLGLRFVVVWYDEASTNHWYFHRIPLFLCYNALYNSRRFASIASFGWHRILRFTLSAISAHLKQFGKETVKQTQNNHQLLISVHTNQEQRISLLEINEHCNFKQVTF